MHDIAVVGAGPYGLSIAAHLAELGADFRIFGVPMQTWRQSMPRGMRLKSEGFASSLYDPAGALPLSRYCAARGIDYAAIGLPVPVATFIDYGLAFQQRFAPMLEQTQVTSLAGGDGRFEVALEDGTSAAFRKVVLAVGISHYAYTAPPMAALPPELGSHASVRSDYSGFAGRTVAVVGGGASAVDCAVELAAAGARAHLVTRRPALRFHGPPRRRTVLDQVRAPFTAIGSGWKSVALTQAPLLFHALPERLRHHVTRRYLGPAACWFTRDRIAAGVQVSAGTLVHRAVERGGRCLMTLEQGGDRRSLEVDHVIAATGYRVDLARLPFLSSGVRSRIASAADTPILSRNFEASTPGLYFVGASAANAFGPLLRFACGAEFTARRLSRHLARPCGNMASARHDRAPIPLVSGTAG